MGIRVCAASGAGRRLFRVIAAGLLSCDRQDETADAKRYASRRLYTTRSWRLSGKVLFDRGWVSRTLLRTNYASLSTVQSEFGDRCVVGVIVQDSAMARCDTARNNWVSSSSCF